MLALAGKSQFRYQAWILLNLASPGLSNSPWRAPRQQEFSHCPPSPSFGELHTEVAGKCHRPVIPRSASNLPGDRDLLPFMQNHDGYPWGTIWADFTNHCVRGHCACDPVTLPALQIRSFLASAAKQSCHSPVASLCVKAQASSSPLSYKAVKKDNLTFKNQVTLAECAENVCF